MADDLPIEHLDDAVGTLCEIEVVGHDQQRLAALFGEGFEYLKVRRP